MSYIKNTWLDGDIITAEKLNHLEDGVSQVGIPGPQGEKGEKGDKGDPGKDGLGLIGEPTILVPMQTYSEAGVFDKINEIIDVLNIRGVSRVE